MQTSLIKMVRKFLLLWVVREGKQKSAIMGCYGIGISRTFMASVEQHSTEDGIVWPAEIAPFKVHVIPVNMKNEEQVEIATNLYNQLKSKGVEVLLDDRNERAGSKFKDADLIGLPYRIVVGKDVSEGKVEFRDRTKDTKELVDLLEVLYIERRKKNEKRGTYSLTIYQ